MQRDQEFQIIQEVEKSSFLQAYINFLMSIIGLSIIAYPYVTFEVGWLLAIILVTPIIICTMRSTILLIEVAADLGSNSYPFLVRQTLGSFWARVIDFIIISIQVGIGLAYIIFLTQGMIQGLSQLNYILEKWQVYMICFLIVLPLLLIKNMHFFHATSTLSFCLASTAKLFVVFQSSYLIYQGAYSFENAIKISSTTHLNYKIHSNLLVSQSSYLRLDLLFCLFESRCLISKQCLVQLEISACCKSFIYISTYAYDDSSYNFIYNLLRRNKRNCNIQHLELINVRVSNNILFNSSLTMLSPIIISCNRNYRELFSNIRYSRRDICQKISVNSNKNNLWNNYERDGILNSEFNIILKFFGKFIWISVIINFSHINSLFQFQEQEQQFTMGHICRVSYVGYYFDDLGYMGFLGGVAMIYSKKNNQFQ